MRMFCLINNTVEAQMQYQRAWNEEQQETPPVSSAINYPTPQQSVDPQLANQQYVEQQYVDQFGLPIPQSLLGSMGTGDLLHTLSIFKNISDNESAHSKDNQNEPESEEPNRLDVPEENKDTDITVLKAYNQHKRTDSSSSSSSGMSYAGAVPEQDLVKKDESIPFRRHSDLSYNTFQPLPQDNSWMHMSQPSTSQYDATSSHYGELSQYDQNLTYGDSLHYVDPSPYIDPSLYGQSSGNDQTVPYVEESGSGNIPPYGDPVYFEELSRYMYNTFQSTPPPSVSVPPPQPSVHIPNEPGIQEILEQNLESFAPFELNTPQNPVVHFPQRTESRIVIPQARVPDQDLSNLAAAGQVARAFKPEKVFEIEGGGLTMAGYVTLEEVLDTFETDELNTLLAYTGSIDTVMVPASIKTIRKKVTSATYEYINEFVFDLMHALMNAYSYYSSLSLEPGAVAMVCYKVRFYEILMRKFPNYDFSHIESHSVSLGPLKRKEKKE
ncbi:uncharacterized protein [Onthophagus taurus]|uniref:uncharacterized protein n=1 Tax=Onthophagus taurus TaxID=166361 RepID=UPI0039BE72D8